MTGKQRIEAAFSPGGSPEIPAVICYEGIYVRDHWSELTSCPWWYRHEPDLERQVEWRRDALTKTGQDWFHLPECMSASERARLAIDVRDTGVYRVDRETGKERELVAPRVSGWKTEDRLHSVHPGHMPSSTDEIDERVPESPAGDPADLLTEGEGDLASLMLEEFGGRYYPTGAVSTPLWNCYSLWGFEGLMAAIATNPELVEHACRRFLAHRLREVRRAAALGAAGIWIEECFTDMVGPCDFERLAVPFVAAIVEAVREAGMRSIYYFCGDPQGKWSMLLEPGADALSLEESKKRFRIDIGDVAKRVDGRCTILGNLDAIGVLQDGSESQLRREISRQIEAGRRNGRRFIMSLGSPVTPGTPVDRVRRYCDLAHKLGR